MNREIKIWLAFRALRWLAWIGFFAYSLHFIAYRGSHLNSFGNLLPSTEAAMFGFAIVGIFAGFFELMVRERAGLDRPAPGQLIPPRTTARVATPPR